MVVPIKIGGIGDSITAERKFVSPPLVVYYEKLGLYIPIEYPNTTWGDYIYADADNKYNIANTSFVNHGHGGWATQNYTGNPGLGHRNDWQRQALDEHFDIVTIMLGINDHAYENPAVHVARVSLTDYQANLEYFADTLQAQNPNIKIIFITSIVKTDDANGVNRLRLEQYNDVMRSVATAKGCVLIDAYAHFWTLSGQNENTFATTYTLDNVHLNQTGQNELYGLVHNEVINYIEPVIGTPDVTKVGETFQMDCTVDALMAGDVKIFQYRVGSGAWINFDATEPTLVSGTTYRDTVAYSIATDDVQFRAKVTRNGTPYYSGIVTYSIIWPGSYAIRAYEHYVEMQPQAAQGSYAIRAYEGLIDIPLADFGSFSIRSYEPQINTYPYLGVPSIAEGTASILATVALQGYPGIDASRTSSALLGMGEIAEPSTPTITPQGMPEAESSTEPSIALSGQPSISSAGSTMAIQGTPQEEQTDDPTINFTVGE